MNMLRPLARLSTAVTIAAALVLCSVSVATAARAKFDTSYQNGGTLMLPQQRGVYGQVVQTCEVSGNRLNVAGRFGPNAPGIPFQWSTSQSLATASVKIRPRQPMMLGIAEVSWKKQRIPTRHVVRAQDYDEAGGFAYITRSALKSQYTKLKLFRVLPGGRRNAKFGNRGFISITIADLTGRYPDLRVIALGGGEVIVLARTDKAEYVMRFTKTGAADKTWGTDGVVKLDAPKPYPDLYALKATDSATALPGGGLLISASNLPGQPSTGKLGILKLTRLGKPDANWGKSGFWTPPAAIAPKNSATPYSTTGQSILTSIRKNGDYAILYVDGVSLDGGSRSELKLAYVDEDSGVTTLFNDDVGTYSNAGDGGDPDSNPWALGESNDGTVFATAFSEYTGAGAARGQLTRFSASANQQVKDLTLSSAGFPVDAFAIDPKSKFVYACGSMGSTSSKTKIVANRDQRKTIAIRRVGL